MGLPPLPERLVVAWCASVFPIMVLQHPNRSIFLFGTAMAPIILSKCRTPKERMSAPHPRQETNEGGTMIDPKLGQINTILRVQEDTTALLSEPQT